MTRQPPAISAAIACYNEARDLSRSLPRLAFCDEIVVVDLGSEDRSVEVARAHGARVVEHAWVPFREKIARLMVERARHDWVLFSDPDLLFPDGVGDRLKSLLLDDDLDNLAMVYLPMRTCFQGRPLRRGQKGDVRGYRALIHRRRVHLADLLHHKGVGHHAGTATVCLRPRHPEEVILHDWVDGWSDLMDRARRYLPYEGEARLATGRPFSWGGALREIWSGLKTDLRTGAILDWRACQVMLFQLWYTWQANLAARNHERSRPAVTSGGRDRES